METLPDEVLEVVFSYCSVRDLVSSVQHVCWHWKRVVHTSRLWRDVIYRPDKVDTDSHIVSMLCGSAVLQAVDFSARIYGQMVFQALADNCPELKTLLVHVDQDINYDVLKAIHEKCTKIEQLSPPLSVVSSPEKCQIVGEFINLKILSLVAPLQYPCSILCLKDIADGCPQLQHLTLLFGGYFTNDLFYTMVKKKDHLHTIEVSCINFCGMCTLPLLSVCSSLKTLHMHNSCNSESHFKVNSLRKLRALTSLSWEGFHHEDQMLKIFDNKNLVQLLELTLISCNAYNDSVTEVIVQNCPLLQCITLELCSNFSDDSLRLFSSLAYLNTLRIYGNSHITDRGIMSLQQVDQLLCLSLGQCKNLTSASLEVVANLSKLHELRLMLQDLEGLPVDLLATHMKALKRLHIINCYNVDILALEWLKSKVPRIRLKLIFL
ncbi:uncharacterized protein [Anabrus simplex]|uniref:uncharacterized protein n=1 Tax=Anabrus simplex TaxID=316456 RepID=UPI0035A3C633